jgi:hypothetical protein
MMTEARIMTHIAFVGDACPDPYAAVRALREHGYDVY